MLLRLNSDRTDITVQLCKDTSNSSFVFCFIFFVECELSVVNLSSGHCSLTSQNKTYACPHLILLYNITTLPTKNHDTVIWTFKFVATFHSKT